MKKALLLLAPLFLLTACEGPNSITGTLALKSATQIGQGNGKSVALAAGTYTAQAKMGSGGGTFTIKTKQGTIRFAVPQLVADSQGNFSATAAAIGQPFSVKGRIFDTQSHFDRIGSESCSLGTEQQCSWGTDANGNPSYDCVDVPVTGSQNAHQVGYDSWKNVQISLVKGSVIGTFSGSYNLGESLTTDDAVSDCQ